MDYTNNNQGDMVLTLAVGSKVEHKGLPDLGVGEVGWLNDRVADVLWSNDRRPQSHYLDDLAPANTNSPLLGEEEEMEQKYEMEQTVLDAGGMLGHVKGYESTETGAIYKVEWENGKSTRHVPGALYPVAPLEPNKVATPKDVKDMVTSIATKAPELGRELSYDVLDVIEAWDLNFSLGNVIQLVFSAGQDSKTEELEDLKLAAAYLKRRIDKLEAGK